jgi:hypothetical protein
VIEATKISSMPTLLATEMHALGFSMIAI